jgi:hypothetical protein
VEQHCTKAICDLGDREISHVFSINRRVIANVRKASRWRGHSRSQRVTAPVRSFAERTRELRGRRIDAEEIIRDDLMLQPTGIRREAD